jgi:hypothetical protein
MIVGSAKLAMRGKVILAGLKLTVSTITLHVQNQLGSDDLSGKIKLKVEPLPTSLSIHVEIVRCLQDAAFSIIPSRALTRRSRLSTPAR